ncbi:MAG: hypothetical protein JRH15_09610 [Deltaproteobacteria bacterium]|nr:hypothetical protein [Deltaproteobacteria bacterium]
MLHIKEIFPDRESVTIKADGKLDRESLQILEEVIEDNQKEGRRVSLLLRGIIRADRDGKDFLIKYRDSLPMEGLSEFLKKEIGFSDS